MAKEKLIRFLDTDGDGEGVVNAVGNYSLIATSFKISPGSDEVYEITRGSIILEAAPSNMTMNYIGAGGLLTNGITVAHRTDKDIITDFTLGVPIKATASWMRICSKLVTVGYDTKVGLVRMDWDTGGIPIELVGSQGEYLEILLNDSFVGMNQQYFQVQGWIA